MTSQRQRTGAGYWQKERSWHGGSWMPGADLEGTPKSWPAARGWLDGLELGIWH